MRISDWSSDVCSSDLDLAVSDAIYRVDAVTRRAAALQAHPLTTGPRVALHPRDAAAANLVEGAMAKLSNQSGAATLQVVLDDRVAHGSAGVERGYGATAALSAGPARVDRRIVVWGTRGSVRLALGGRRI